MLAPIRWIIALVSALASLVAGTKEEAPKAAAPAAPAVVQTVQREGHVLISGPMLEERSGRWVCRVSEAPVRPEARALKIERAAARPLTAGRG